jgi:hypothetical protein
MDYNIITINQNYVNGDENIFLTNKLSSHKSLELAYSAIYTNEYLERGSIVVTVYYQLPVIHKVLSERQKFSVFKSKDNQVRWIMNQ